jgi:hypothetical protein
MPLSSEFILETHSGHSQKYSTSTGSASKDCRSKNASVVATLVRYLLAPFLAAAVIAWAGTRKDAQPKSREMPPSNPLQFGSALQMALLFQIVLFAVRWAQNSWGQTGLFVSAGILGLTDMDALVISVAKSAAPGLAPTTVALGDYHWRTGQHDLEVDNRSRDWTRAFSADCGTRSLCRGNCVRIGNSLGPIIIAVMLDGAPASEVLDEQEAPSFVRDLTGFSRLTGYGGRGRGICKRE